MMNKFFISSGVQRPQVFSSAAGNPTVAPDMSPGLPPTHLHFKQFQQPHSLFMKSPIKPLFGEFGLFSATENSNRVKTTVVVSSAVALEGKQIEMIAKKMRKLTGVKELDVESSVDSSLIAGFVVHYDDGEGKPSVIDLSIKGQLENLADRIETSEKSAEQEQSWRF